MARGEQGQFTFQMLHVAVCLTACETEPVQCTGERRAKDSEKDHRMAA